MSITDELREWFKDRIFMANGWQEIRDIADRIDAEHESAMYNMRREHDEWVADRDAKWVKLPLDADDVPIRVGDVLTDGEHTFTVCELAAFGGGSWSIRNEDGNAWAACDVTHHHEPTVEDVLREFSNRVCNSGHQWGLDADDTIAEFAAKLRLAEEVSK